jgi:Lon protease-like protein
MMKYAIFPLNVFVLPGEQTYLHIFEPRYKELLEDVENANTPFGLFYENDENVASYGTMVKLVEVVKRYPDGELDIQIEGDYIFRMETFYKTLGSKSYAGGKVSRIDLKENIFLDEESLNQMSEFIRSRDGDKLLEIPSRIWDSAVELGLTSQDKYAIAKTNLQENQLALLRSHIQLKKAIIEQEKALKFNSFLN